ATRRSSLTHTPGTSSRSRARHTTPMAPRPIGSTRLYRPAMTRPVIGGIAGRYQRSGVLADRQQRAGGFGEKVVALVVNDDEGGEVPDLDLPHRLHAEFGVFEDLDLCDAVLGESRRRAADRPQIEAAVRLARVRDGLAAVALGQHDQGAASGLETLHVGVHPAGGGRPERAGGVPLG